MRLLCIYVHFTYFCIDPWIQRTMQVATFTRSTLLPIEGVINYQGHDVLIPLYNGSRNRTWNCHIGQSKWPLLLFLIAPFPVITIIVLDLCSFHQHQLDDHNFLSMSGDCTFQSSYASVYVLDDHLDFPPDDMNGCGVQNWGRRLYTCVNYQLWPLYGNSVAVFYLPRNNINQSTLASSDDCIELQYKQKATPGTP